MRYQLASSGKRDQWNRPNRLHQPIQPIVSCHHRWSLPGCNKLGYPRRTFQHCCRPSESCLRRFGERPCGPVQRAFGRNLCLLLRRRSRVVGRVSRQRQERRRRRFRMCRRRGEGASSRLLRGCRPACPESHLELLGLAGRRRRRRQRRRGWQQMRTVVEQGGRFHIVNGWSFERCTGH